MSFGLVIVAAIALVIGLLQSGLAIIYVSIGCSVVAGVVLAVAVLRGRPEPAAVGAPAGRPAYQGGSPPPAPAPGSWQPPAPAPAPSAVAAPSAAPSAPQAAPPPPPPAPSPPPPPPGREPAPAEREPAYAGAAAGGATADHTEQLDQEAIRQAVAVDGFPIHDYESLRATEILPMLAELDTDQLQEVRQHEAAGKNRFMILSRIDEEMESRGAGEWEVDEEGWEEEEEEQAAEPVAPARVSTGEFPIPNYQELGALQVLGQLNDLDAEELEAVREREQMGSRRSMVLKRIERLLSESDRRRVTVPAPEPDIDDEDGGFDDEDEAPAPIAVKPVRTRRSPGTATRPAGARKPAVTRKAATKTAATRKAATRKAATRTAATRTAATRTAATRTAATRKAAPAKRGAPTGGRAPAATPATRAPARKAAGVGKASVGKRAGASKAGASGTAATAARAKRSAASANKATPTAKRSAGIKKTARAAPAKRGAKRR